MKIRSLSILGLAALAGALALPAQAFDGSNSMIVVKDPVTGQLRAPTAEEAAALTAAKSGSAKSAAKGEITFEALKHPTGAVGARNNSDEMANYSVVVKRADGTLAEICVASKGDAEKVIQSGELPAQPATDK